MVNGLGVVGWGVGGIEAEAAMLGQPISMLIPKVVGFSLSASFPEGTTATDLVLTVTELLRRHGVVGKFVEFYGPGVANVPLENRATIGNMSPEYGSTITIFPIDAETLRYLRFTGRPDGARRPGRGLRQGAGPVVRPDRRSRSSPRRSSSTCRRIVPSLAGPSRPQDRVPLRQVEALFADRPRARPMPAAGARQQPDEAVAESFPASDPPPRRPAARRRPTPASRADGARRRAEHRPARSGAVPVTRPAGRRSTLDHGHVVIAAITSCTNTSNPSVMLAAGLLAKNAVERGLMTKPWVKTSLAPGSRVVMDYYERAGLDALPRQARLQPGRLRLHDLHRQLRSAAGRRSRRRSTTTTSPSSRCCRATGTSRAASTPTSA